MFPSDHAAKTHIICFHLCRLSIREIPDSLRRFEMEFHVVRWLASSSIE
jgi:hypothetical protein